VYINGRGHARGVRLKTKASHVYASIYVYQVYRGVGVNPEASPIYASIYVCTVCINGHGRARSVWVNPQASHIWLCVLCVGPLCGPPLRWGGRSSAGYSSLCGSPVGGFHPLSCSRFPWHLFLVLPLARAYALAVYIRIYLCIHSVCKV